MHETEVKAINIDRNVIVQKLLSMGAKKSFEGEIHAVSFDFPDKSIRNATRTLRLRTKGDKCFLTLKNPVNNSDVKIREELELEVSDFETMKKILESLNLKQWRDVRKTRVSYSLQGILFEFDKYHDEYEYIPEFMEIEVLSENDKAAMKTIFEYAGKLGIPRENCKPWTLNELVRHYSKS